MTSWTTEQITALAPDAGSLKAGKELATTRKWRLLGRDDQCVWGECQGSGKNPYRTQIDLTEPAFNCSCPSRKFPCKHGLALFLLLVSSPEAFTPYQPPTWVTDWLAARVKRAETRAKRAAQTEIVDPEAQAKRAAEREAKVAAGMAEIDLWLRDLVRQGLVAAQEQPTSFWENTAARMVDAQAPGVGRMVREMAGIPSSGAGWMDRLLERLGQLHLLLEGYHRLETLPPALQSDVRTLIGWSQSQEELMAETGTRDRWRVMGQRVEEQEKLRIQRLWLLGEESGAYALVLNFAHGTAPLDVTLMPGTLVDAELVFYPSAYPQRAIVKARHGSASPLAGMPGFSTIAAAIESHAAVLAQLPWLERSPMSLLGVLPMQQEGKWFLRDPHDTVLPLSPRFEGSWRLVALSGGHPMTVFGEWDGTAFRPLSVWAEQRFVGFEGKS